MWGAILDAMDFHWLRLTRVTLTYASMGLVMGAVIATDDQFADYLNNPEYTQNLFLTFIEVFVGALVGEEAWRGLLMGVLLGGSWGSVLVLAKRWYLGALLALPSTVIGIWLYFSIWPVESWDITAWHASRVLLASYWEYLLPLTLLGGGLSTWWSARPLPQAAWTKMLSDPEEENVG